MKIFLSALILGFVPGLALAACPVHDDVVSSCIEGTVWDPETRSCVTTTS